MHKEIDRFTDTHPIVARSKSRLGQRGYLKPVVVDILYDHLLVNNWGRFCTLDTHQFISSFNTKAGEAILVYPEKPRAIVTGLIHSGYLSSYSNWEGLQAALVRIDKRLSKRLLAVESASNYMALIEKQFQALQGDFLEFFPELIAHFKTRSAWHAGAHWLK